MKKQIIADYARVEKRFMTRKVTAPCFRTRLLLLPTLSNRLPPDRPHSTNPLVIGDKTPKPYCPGMMLGPPTRSLSAGQRAHHNLACLLPKQHTPRFSSQRTMFCCA